MKTIPWAHQQKEYEEHLDSKGRAILWGMRCGKSKLILDQMSSLYLTSGLNGGLILAPSGVHINWIKREVPKHMWDGINIATMSWISSLSRKKGYAEKQDLFLNYKGFKLLTVNYEALRIERVQNFIKKYLKVCKNRIYFVADESHHLGHSGSRQSRLSKNLAKLCEVQRIMSGTAILNSPLQAYSQYNILEPGALGFTRYEDFKLRYAIYRIQRLRNGKQYPALDKYINLEELRSKMAKWSSVVLREDIDDMPALIMTDRACMLSEKQIKAYTEMVDYTLKTECGSTVSAKEAAGRLSKLQQILGGFVYDAKGNVVSIDDNPPRLDAVAEEALGTQPGKFIVWCRFTEDIRRVAKRLRNEGLNIVEFHGKISDNQKEEALDRFQNDSLVNGVVGQPQSGGEGRDFSKAVAIINYSHSHNAITRNQSIERGTKKGGDSVAVIDLYSPGTIEESILACLEKKESISNMVAGTGLQNILQATNI